MVTDRMVTCSSENGHYRDTREWDTLIYLEEVNNEVVLL